MKLNLGAGGAIKPKDEGWINIDVRRLPGIDKVMDLEKENLPYAPNSIEHINMQDFLEHLSRWRQESFLQNIYDVLEPGGDCYIQVPHLRVNAERYLGIIKNPHPMQTPLDGDGFAGTLFGGQEYPENYHKWAYDEKSLTQALNKAGLVVTSIGTDGGMNMLCMCIKPPENVFIMIGGGLGDAIQTYLSSPKVVNDNYADGSFPSTSPTMSYWWRRLRSIKGKYPHIWIKAVVKSHNKYTKDLLEFHPYINEIINVEWSDPLAGDALLGYVEPYDSYNIYSVFNVNSIWNPSVFEADPPTIYLNEFEQALIDRLTPTKYIVVHPFAGMPHRATMPEEGYIPIIDKLITKGLMVVVIGGGRDECFTYTRNGLVNLVNKSNVRVSTSLVMGCSGFIGSHSSMILPAWYKGVRSVCIVPPYHDGRQDWMEFWNSDNPTVWGAHKEFNKTIMIEPGQCVDPDEAVDWMEGI